MIWMRKQDTMVRRRRQQAREVPLMMQGSRRIERETEEEILEDVRPTERTSGLLDLKASEYFTKYPKAIANPQERSLKLFNEDAQGLPEGWKVRLLKDPRDEGKTVRHYL